MLNSFNSWLKLRKEGITDNSHGGDTFLNVETGCLCLLTAKRVFILTNRSGFEYRRFTVSLDIGNG